MTIGRRKVPTGELAITFRRFDDEKPPYCWIDVMPESDDDALGGVALNCLNVGDLATIDDLREKRFSFDRHSEGELAESVFWRPQRESLEIENLVVHFGAVQAGLVELTIQAQCFDLAGNSGIKVVVNGAARIVEG
jgi:hypothetical protein